MRPVSEIRRENLELLIEEEGTIPALNEKLGRRRNDPSLSFIRAQSVRSSTGKPYLMGDKLARDIESKLKLGRGWMDTDHTGMLIDSIENLRTACASWSWPIQDQWEMIRACWSRM